MSERKKDSLDLGFYRLFGDTLSRRQQGAVLGGLVATLIFSIPVAIREQIDIKSQQDAVKNEQKANTKMETLAKKYNVASLSQESQDAFWRLVQLHLEDIDALYLDPVEAGDLLQHDIANLAAELIAKGEVVDEYKLAKELIPDSSKDGITNAGFEFTPLAPVHCDAGVEPSYSPFDYSNRLGREFKVRYKKDGEIVSIPLGSKQTPAPTRERLDWPFDAWRRDPFDPSNIQTPPLYKVAGCAILNTYTDDRKRPVKWVYSK